MDTQIKSLPRLNASFNKSNANSSLDASSTIVHLGVGAFHRAHQAWYTQKALETENSDSWKIIGVSLRSATMAEQLNPQNAMLIFELLSYPHPQCMKINSSCRAGSAVVESCSMDTK